MTHLLVLGGTSFVGRAVVAAAQDRGLDVTTVNRGASNPDMPGVRALRADRYDPAQVRSVLGDERFEAVIDVSALAPVQVRATAGIVQSSHYTLVSTVSTYADNAYELAPGELITEASPTVAGSPDDEAIADMATYGIQKRGCELAALRAFGAEGTLIARPGLILGPHENVHRVPYWLGRIAAGGDVIAPGRPGRSFQFVDVTDLARWLVSGSLDRLTGTYNAVNPPGRDTWQDWLGACADVTDSTARLHWIDDTTLVGEGVEVGFGLPMWFATDLPDFSDDRIRATGFTSRPLMDTVRESWEWLRGADDPRGGYRPQPMTRAQEERILAALGIG